MKKKMDKQMQCIGKFPDVFFNLKGDSLLGLKLLIGAMAFWLLGASFGLLFYDRSRTLGSMS